jgi:hypothetical protein
MFEGDPTDGSHFVRSWEYHHQIPACEQTVTFIESGDDGGLITGNITG